METLQQLQLTEFGSTEVLTLSSVTDSPLGPNQVRVRGAYASVNPIDVKTRAGLGWAAQANADKLPWTLGYDYSGQITEIGDQVTDLQIGDYVCGLIGFPLIAGAYSQSVISDQDDWHVVSGSHLIQAAALPLAGLTAWQALFEHTSVTENSRVLILAAAGGVGHIAVQIAKNAGAWVAGTSSESNLDFIQSLGCDLAIDYKNTDAWKELQPVDVLIDLVGGNAGLEALAFVKPDGVALTVPTISKDAFIEKATSLGLDATGMLMHASREQMQALLSQLNQEQLSIHVSASYMLNQGALAHQQLETGHTRGKVLLELA
ncbi:NADP-dependent oxidoreductase [Alginatibacterium sediminis]|uniref:NADP-dependent oxidoreductase n=1 Tax=Alginatibacterium sediminis TaxID=2164068 RepID=A0A420EA13_9ALTE|nr:NADP-dependent oxidoreductase [Alginatibacterium sediminis]RKF17523.1 NADP-dependent oxidoreductase [Alginatibacterium sediminis]